MQRQHIYLSPSVPPGCHFLFFFYHHCENSCTRDHLYISQCKRVNVHEPSCTSSSNRRNTLNTKAYIYVTILINIRSLPWASFWGMIRQSFSWKECTYKKNTYDYAVEKPLQDWDKRRVHFWYRGYCGAEFLLTASLRSCTWASRERMQYPMTEMSF